MEITQTYQIRKMTEEDLDAVLAIEEVSYTTPWQSEHFRNEISARYSFPFVAVENEEVIGYLCLMSLFEEAQILNVATLQSRRGMGVARALIEMAIINAVENGAEVLALEVRASNVPAISLYEKLGFRRSGVRLKYYDGVEDALLMEKLLKEIP